VGKQLGDAIALIGMEALDLKKGDKIEIRFGGGKVFEVGRNRGRERALACLRKLRRSLPPGFIFDHADANAR
jgi:hypothetical protein